MFKLVQFKIHRKTKKKKTPQKGKYKNNLEGQVSSPLKSVVIGLSLC
jgi:hypothetical protein